MPKLILKPGGASKLDKKLLSKASDERTVDRLFFRDDYETATPACIGVAATTAEITHDSGTQGTVTPFEGAKMLRVSDVSHVTQQVYYQFGQMKDGKIAVEVRWWKDADTADMVIKIEHHDKVTIDEYGIRFLESGMKWQYFNSAGSYADLTGGGEDIADGTWNYLRLTIDIKNNKYVRLETGVLNVAMGTLAGDTTADVVNEGKTKIIFGANTAAADDDAYYDDFRVYDKVEES